MKVALRVDATSHIGAGHLFRSLTLVDKLVATNFCAPADIVFLSHQLGSSFKNLINARGYEITEIELVEWDEPADAEFCSNYLKQRDFFDLVIVDHYELTAVWEKAIAKLCHTMVVIDDLANRAHSCDILLDQTMGRQKADYKSLTPDYTQLLLGTDYVLLREQFSQFHEKASLKRARTKHIEQLLISVGATDHLELSTQFIEWLNEYFVTQQLTPIATTVVISSAASSINKLKGMRAKFPWLTLVVDATNMAELIYQADIAIGACGTSSWERCVLGLPTLSLITAENQRLVNSSLEIAGAILDLGHAATLTKHHFLKLFNKLLTDIDLYQRISKAALNVCNQAGAQDVVTLIKQQTLVLRKAEQADCMQLFAWQSNPDIRKFARNNKPVKIDEHLSWFASVIANPKRHLYIVEVNNHPMGMLRLDALEKPQQYEISILIAPEAQGRRLALRALKSVPAEFSGATVYATVLSENIASHKLFLQAGYQQINPTTYYYQY